MIQHKSSLFCIATTVLFVARIHTARIDGFVGDNLNLAADFSRLLGASAPQPAPATNSSLVWQPLRATFRPLNRQPQPATPPVPQPQPPPTPAQPSDALALASTSEFASEPLEPLRPQPPAAPTPAPAASSEFEDNFDRDDEQPTRVPLNRFRPTKAPSIDSQAQPNRAGDNNLRDPSAAASGSQVIGNGNSNTNATNQVPQYRMSHECFECICEASTSCNLKSRCQTSDVRHTRCGLFLISYDQWLDTGLSKQLVTREAIQRDPAADERAFYECVTDRECAERLLTIYMQRNAKDCDKDGRIDCYDLAAIHQGGTEGCAGETLLDSQYWSDFNACFGFGR